MRGEGRQQDLFFLRVSERNGRIIIGHTPKNGANHVLDVRFCSSFRRYMQPDLSSKPFGRC